MSGQSHKEKVIEILWEWEHGNFEAGKHYDRNDEVAVDELNKHYKERTRIDVERIIDLLKDAFREIMGLENVMVIKRFLQKLEQEKNLIVFVNKTVE